MERDTRSDTDTDTDNAAVWIDADAELVEALGREAQLTDESLTEYIENACRRRARR